MFHASYVWFLSLIIPEEALSSLGETLVSLESLSLPSLIICSSNDETQSPSGEAFNLSCGTSIEPSTKTCDQVSQAGYWLHLLGVILEFDLAQGGTKSLSVVICRPADETVSPLGNAFYLSSGTSIESLSDTRGQVSQNRYRPLLLGVILEFYLAQEGTKSLRRGFS